MTQVIYDSDTGEVVAVGDAEPAEGQDAADISDTDIPDEITGTRVDDVADPSEVVRDQSLPQPEDIQARMTAREWAQKEMECQALRDASPQDLPDGVDEAACQAALSEVESELQNVGSGGGGGA